MKTRHRWAQAACLVMALAWCGCGPRARPGQLTGKVRIPGGVLPSGIVTVLGADGRARCAEIAPDGTYKVAGVAPGAARIGVESRRRLPPPGINRGPREPGPIKLPPHYAKPETSGITCEVKGGEQTFDIDLKPAAAQRPQGARAAGTPHRGGAF